MNYDQFTRDGFCCCAGYDLHILLPRRLFYDISDFWGIETTKSLVDHTHDDPGYCHPVDLFSSI